MIDLSEIERSIIKLRCILNPYQGYMTDGVLYLGSSLSSGVGTRIELHPMYLDYPFEGSVFFEFSEDGGPSHLVLPFKSIR